MGESWHNNITPSQLRRHGLYPGQIDLGWDLILLREKLGLAGTSSSRTLPRGGNTRTTSALSSPTGQEQM